MLDGRVMWSVNDIVFVLVTLVVFAALALLVGILARFDEEDPA
ncbi:hypothetical protein GCM10028771_17630 [Nocardioides marmoraquaticus]